MTPERLKELRAFANREYGISPSMACELVAEVERLHAAVERVKGLPRYDTISKPYLGCYVGAVADCRVSQALVGAGAAAAAGGERMKWHAIDDERPEDGESANATPAIDAHVFKHDGDRYEWRVEIRNGDHHARHRRGSRRHVVIREELRRVVPAPLDRVAGRRARHHAD